MVKDIQMNGFALDQGCQTPILTKGEKVAIYHVMITCHCKFDIPALD